MQHKLPPLPVRIAVLVIVLGTLGYFGFRSISNERNSTLTASGSIEAVIVNVAPEMSGKVSEVLADEGQPVKTDDPLLRLDPSLLTAQRAVAAAQVDSANSALAAAQTKYDQTLQAALSAQEAQRAKDLRFSAPDEFNQPAWYFNQAEQLAAAQMEVDVAQAALEDALKNLQNVTSDLNNANYVTAEERLARARAAFLVADSVKVQAENAIEGGGLQDAAYDYYNTALDELNDAQRAYNALLNTQAREDVEYARGKVIVAQQRYDAAYAELLTLQTGAESPAVIAAAKALDQANAALAQAESNLALLDTQIAKLTIAAPMDGVVLTRNVEPGEFVQPGASALTMADLSELTITVYIPEDRYGLISLGQPAEVRVDSFPDLTFTARVVFIADQAEYTPRNVQTVEGRSATMFAIKLSVQDPDGRLKPGMPADVTFQ
jgi:multidrug resistance efflux pump